MMNCETTKDTLIDLAYGELDDVRQAAVHQHLDSCANCHAEWTMLQRGRRAASLIALASPPEISPELLSIIDAGHSAVGSAGPVSGKAIGDPDRSGQRTANSRDSVSKMVAVTAPNQTPLMSNADPVREPATVVELRANSRWLDRVATLAMRREVAMAAVFVVAVGVGITTLYSPSQQLAVSEDGRARTVVPAVEVNPEQPRGTAGAAPTAVAPRIRGIAAEPNARPTDFRRAEGQPTLPSSATPALAESEQPTLESARGGRGAPIAHRSGSVGEFAPATLGAQSADDQASQDFGNSVGSTNAPAQAAPQVQRQWQQPVAGADNNNTGAAQGSAVGSNYAQTNLRAQAQQNLMQPQPRNAVAPTASPPAVNYAMSNAGAPGTEIAGVSPDPRSPLDNAIQASLSRGDTTTALSQLRQAYASASDDVTRARLRRQIDSLVASNNAAQAAAAASASPSAAVVENSSVTQQVQNQEVSNRRGAARRAPSPTRQRVQNPSNAVDNVGNLGFKPESR